MNQDKIGVFFCATQYLISLFFKRMAAPEPYTKIGADCSEMAPHQSWARPCWLGQSKKKNTYNSSRGSRKILPPASNAAHVRYFFSRFRCFHGKKTALRGLLHSQPAHPHIIQVKLVLFLVILVWIIRFCYFEPSL